MKSYVTHVKHLIFFVSSFAVVNNHKVLTTQFILEEKRWHLLLTISSFQYSEKTFEKHLQIKGLTFNRLWNDTFRR